MSEKKKYRKLKKNFSKKSPSANSLVEKARLPNDDLIKKLKEAVDGLYYLSETDAEIKVFVGRQADSVKVDEILNQTQTAPDVSIEERDFAQFFTRLTTIQDWFGEEEIKTAEKYVHLREILEKNLRDLKIYKIGKIQLDIYVVGLDAENNLLGVQTKAVET